MKIYAKRVWRFISVITFILTIFFGFRAYLQHRHTDYVAVQTYNEWRNQLVGIQNYLYSTGPGEKLHPHFSWSQNPNMALLNADIFAETSGAIASEAAAAFSGQLTNDFIEMAMVNQTLSSEYDAMIDHGTYVKDVYKFTQPTRISIADRDFAYQQLMNKVLKGLPMTVTSVGQINTLYNDLKALTFGNPAPIGIYSAPFEKFMYSTGQFK